MFTVVVSKHLGFGCLECQRKGMRKKCRRNLIAQACVRFVVDKLALGQILMSKSVALPVLFNLRSILFLLSPTS